MGKRSKVTDVAHWDTIAGRYLVTREAGSEFRLEFRTDANTRYQPINARDDKGAMDWPSENTAWAAAEMHARMLTEGMTHETSVVLIENMSHGLIDQTQQAAPDDGLPRSFAHAIELIRKALTVLDRDDVVGVEMITLRGVLALVNRHARTRQLAPLSEASGAHH